MGTQAHVSTCTCTLCAYVGGGEMGRNVGGKKTSIAGKEGEKEGWREEGGREGLFFDEEMEREKRRKGEREEVQCTCRNEAVKVIEREGE